MLDSQVHTYADDDARAKGLEPDADGAAVIAAMDANGVDAALLVSSWHVYRDDPSYAVHVATEHPSRFRVVAPVDPSSPTLDQWLDTVGSAPMVKGLRLLTWRGAPPWHPDDPAVRRIMKLAANNGLAVCVLCWDDLSRMRLLARTYPDVHLVLDHAGLRQPLRPPAPSDPFMDLPAVVALASDDNLFVKLTGVCTLSHERQPFRDLWHPIAQIIEAFGPDRTMWGSDWTRARAVPYEDVVTAFRDDWPLSRDDREAILGATARRVFNW